MKEILPTLIRKDTGEVEKVECKKDGKNEMPEAPPPRDGMRNGQTKGMRKGSYEKISALLA
jgi:hypothetical protein